jgi:hypothetical protein
VIADKPVNSKQSNASPIGVSGGELPNRLRDSALVDLVHAVVNSNDFVYRF